MATEATENSEKKGGTPLYQRRMTEIQHTMGMFYPQITQITQIGFWPFVYLRHLRNLRITVSFSNFVHLSNLPFRTLSPSLQDPESFRTNGQDERA